jgi:TolA-binding protein
MNEIIVAIIASSAIGGIVSHFLTRQKYKVDTENSEFDLSNKINSYYKKELIEMMQKLDGLKIQIEQLELQVEQLSLDNCQNIDCKNRKTKRKEIIKKYETI